MALIHTVPAFSDNYIWLLENRDGSALVVDPGDGDAVEDALKQHGLRLGGILITHHHYDHVGGVEMLRENHGCPVWGPVNPALPFIDHRLSEGDHLEVGDYSFGVLQVPGHTLDHIAYFQGGAEPLLFCGDTLFAGGCGRIFEGDAPMMHASLSRLASLPADTAVYCAHEYTLANLAFARAADPENDALVARAAQAQALRDGGKATVPSTIAQEQATNPFLRSATPGVRAGLRAAGQQVDDDDVAVFTALRAWKDNF